MRLVTRVGTRPLTSLALPAALVLLALLALPAPATAAPDVLRLGKVEFDLGLSVGGIASVGTKVPTGSGAGAIDLRLTWRTSPRTRLGLRTGVVVGAMQWGQDPYGNDDWVPGVSAFDHYGWKATFLPHVGVVLAIDLVPGIALDLGLGVGNALVGATSRAGGAFFPPCIFAGIGTAIDLVALDTAIVALAVRLDYMGSFLVRSGGTFAPQVGVQFRF